MNVMTQKEVKDYLLSFINESNLDEFNRCVDGDAETVEEANDYMDWCNGNEIDELIETGYSSGILPKDVISEVDQYGGEDCGSTYYIVYKIVREGFADTFIKFDGHYDSWNGTEWYREFSVVTPRKRLVEVTDWI